MTEHPLGQPRVLARDDLERLMRALSEVGTHYGTCYKDHLPCFALLVLQDAEAAEAAK